MFTLTLLLATLAPLPAGTVRVVDPALGPYFDVQSAVDAATDGDTVLVRTGTYPGFEVVDKALAIAGDAGAVVEFTSGVSARNLAEGKTLVLQNLRARGSLLLPSVQHGLLLGQNLGSVRVESCVLEGRSVGPCWFSDGFDGARIQGCTDVALIRCTLLGGAGGYKGPPYGAGGYGFRATSSVVAGFSCLAYGGGATVCCDGASGGSGAQVESGSRLFLASGTCVGANGGQADCTCGIGGNGGFGLRVHDTSTYWHFLPVLQGGAHGHGMGGFGCAPQNGTTGTALFLAGGAVATNLAYGPVRTLVVSPSPARAGTTVTVTVQGTPGESVSLQIGDDATEELRPQGHGVLMVESAGAPRRLLLGMIPASGSLSRQIPLAALPPGDESRVFHLQATHGGIPRERILGAPACLVVLDPAF